ncbi:site-2 protease family protein [Nocardia shimofusensis]|uniref:site-2 protease family protein n=1 Tax=Nocardia shimofusensis TaxID=228596 RepID=UPI00082A00CD|nr:site-2 protease family protein [Nocardia shimofusensis]
MLRGSVPLGRITGVRVDVHWSALATVALFTVVLGRWLASVHGGSPGVWLSAAAGAVGLSAALLAHELAHTIVARRHGVHVERVVLWLLGGLSELREEPPDPAADLRIALAGPLTSAALGAGFLLTGSLLDGLVAAPVLDVLVWLAVMNLLLAVFNLLPGAPLDGGRVLRAVLWRRGGDQFRAAVTAARTGRVIGFALIGAGGLEIVLLGDLSGLWLMMLGWFLTTAARVELSAAGMRHQLANTTVRQVMTERPIALPQTWTVTELLCSDAPRTGHQVFPVVSADGVPVGVLSLRDLLPIPAQHRPTSRLGSVARPLPASARAHPDELLAAVATRTLLRPDLDAVTVVDDGGRLIGILTATDLTTACQRSALGLPIQDRRRGQTT